MGIDLSKELAIRNFTTGLLQAELQRRDEYPYYDEENPDVKDSHYLLLAIEYAARRQRDDAIHYLIKAIPALWPIEKLVNT